MISNLTNYRPEIIQFCLSKKAMETFPKELFEGAKNFEEIADMIEKNFVATFPEGETAMRQLDNYEISEIRDEYCQITENELPQKSLELETAIEEAKRIKREAEEALAIVNNTIRTLAKQVKDGVKETHLEADKTFRIALNGYYLTYTWVDNKCKLAKAEIIPEWDKKNLFAQDEKNRQSMKTLFGIEFPEIKDEV